VAQSRPFSEWPIVKASNNIQEYIYALPHRLLLTRRPGTSKSDIEAWVKTSGVDIGDYWSVQGLNLILKHAKAIYDGVITKVENRNEKNKKKIASKNIFLEENGLSLISFEEEMALDPDGKLLNPPGINNSIYCYQQVSPKACKSLLTLENIPPEYLGYYREIEKVISKTGIKRLDIPYGEPGYVPEWQHSLLSKKERRRYRKWYSRKSVKTSPIAPHEEIPEQIKQAIAKDAILGIISIDKDWVLFDMRGLLRNLYWRKLASIEGISPKEILNKFTGDPVIDPVRNEITFIYKQGVVQVHKEKIVSTKKAPGLLGKLIRDNECPIGLVSIDLGQTHPQSVRYSSVHLHDEKLVSDCKGREFLPQYLLDQLSGYRERTDKLQDRIDELALLNLSSEYQEEFARAKNENTPDKVMRRLEEKFALNMSSLSLSEMSNNSVYIADAYISKKDSDPSLVFFTPGPKKGKNKQPAPQKRKDFRIVEAEFIQVSKEAREELNKKKWELQRSDPGFKKLSKSKEQWAREVGNYTIKQAQKITGRDHIVCVIEDLNVKTMTGSGKRERGWDHFFTHKKENRWFIQALHKAYSERPVHRGGNVIEIFAPGTSITCPKCFARDKNNRFGDQFNCIACEYKANTDLDIATYWIEWVALNGKAVPKPVCERSGGAKNTGVARKPRKTNVIVQIAEEDKNIKIIEPAQCDIENDGSRIPLANIA
jgi:hypothetical protein